MTEHCFATFVPDHMVQKYHHKVVIQNQEKLYKNQKPKISLWGFNDSHFVVFKYYEEVHPLI